MTVSACSRKSVHPGEAPGPDLEEVDGTWHVRDAAMVREVLRSKDGTTQAGFTSESVSTSRLRQPILFADGEEHRTQRSRIARFFAPRVVSDRYRDMMGQRVDSLLSAAGREITLDDLAMEYSVSVAAEVIGLTNSSTAGLSRRLENLFDQPGYDHTTSGGGRSRLTRVLARLTGASPLIPFYLFDVRPAVRARRRTPSEDVITHLIGEGYKGVEIMIECLTYGAAGMVTTREFICMATWHFLGAPALRQRYLVAGEKERLAILGEILRLEPVVGHLYRRTTRDLQVGGRVIPAGALMDLHVRDANADEDVVGESPLELCPGRDIATGYGPEVISFGDGAHKCPGNALAIQETDILMQRLLAMDLTVVSEPTMTWDDLITGYRLRNFRLIVGPQAATHE
ncbi:cytochrome P450 [Tessaracoccus antarcticus]|uniref:Cytochrome P450 n=1 Tax=Tessaracoccus antarcticus TaxID=2479848 RepID=A0A3M0G5E1_9ACTN|nr:cytochrome P450 [Tessaracoccus antarcticus]RMB60054.1 cytochrome P450 [Tessaracoccus antarcticus]